ncbi:protein ALP1-like [Aphis craccivora]|uniref:Protein ALP1-like n=1 Tax=Aphis craccivora TaxID=307492 RepID=A0A6G0VR20_APHCR|nr:protein ALP1-like [Aphis craccivora]
MKIPHFIGVFSRDKLPVKIKQRESAVVNLDLEIGTGTYWVAYKKIGKQVKYYDSCGKLPPPLELQKYFNGCNIEYNYDRDQKYNTTNYGHLCLQFLSCTP